MMASDVDNLKKLLASHGFKIELIGCGCCGSPQLKVEYQGKEIIDDSVVNFDMFASVKEEYTQHIKNSEWLNDIISDLPPGKYNIEHLSFNNEGDLLKFKILDGKYKGKIVEKKTGTFISTKEGKSND